ncbi:SEC-C metal-binding domain-containing protein [Bradyrhizobium genosp. L]|uniref:SEC-C metal-binding domain-containing protein n=1 Tax=Bradyrhizobium genosp. L TaxID=83637 RepID=UPI0032E04653
MIANQWRASCATIAISKTSPAFSITRKRRKSFPSETHVKRGHRIVHGDVELSEKLGRNDLCPCGSGRRFQGLLHAGWGV